MVVAIATELATIDVVISIVRAELKICLRHLALLYLLIPPALQGIIERNDEVL